MVDIVVLGCTGVSGRQTVLYLANHPQRSQFSLAIAARSRGKLDTLVSELSLPKSIEVHVVDVTNFDQVEALVKTAKVVLNTAGPFVHLGPPVVRACARNGVHYLDLTGELNFVRDIVERYAFLASKTGAIIVPSCGLDSLPGDIAVHLANRALKGYSRNAPQPLQIATSTSSYEFEGVTSNGTISTIVSMLTEIPKHQIKEMRRDYYLSPVSGKPTPSPRLVYRMTLPSTLDVVVGGYFLMSTSNKAIIQRSWGLLEYEALTTKSDKAQTERYGSSMVYEEFLRRRNTFSSALLSLAILVAFSLFKLPPVRWFLATLGMKDTSVAIDKNLASNGKLTVINVTTSVPSPASSEVVKVQTTFSGKGDPGYYLSPIMMAESGLALLLNREELPALSRKGGVLTPAVAFGDAVVKRLQDSGKFDIRCEVITGRGESRKSI